MKLLNKRCIICGGEYAITQMHCLQCRSRTELPADSDQKSQFCIISDQELLRDIASLDSEEFELFEMFIKRRGHLASLVKYYDSSHATIKDRMESIWRKLHFHESIGNQDDELLERDEIIKIVRQAVRESLTADQEARFLPVISFVNSSPELKHLYHLYGVDNNLNRAEFLDEYLQEDPCFILMTEGERTHYLMMTDLTDRVFVQQWQESGARPYPGYEDKLTRYLKEE